MEALTVKLPDLSVEKLANMKLVLDRNDLSELSTPSGKTIGASRFAQSQSLSRARSNRKVSRQSRRSGSFISSHRNQMSMELTTQAESKFLALMELIASASREALALKEFWARIISERQSFSQERDELIEQITEINEELDTKEIDQEKHKDESADRKRQVEKLLVELSVAIDNVAVEKKKYADSELKFDKTLTELREVRESFTRTTTEYDKYRSDYESIQSLLKTAELERDSARGEAETHHKDLLRMTRERTEISIKLHDITSQYEHYRKEVSMLEERMEKYNLEREEHHHEVIRLREDIRRAKLRAEGVSKDLVEMTEKYDSVERETHKYKENIQIIETARNGYSHTCEQLRRELKTMSTFRDEAEERYSDINVKCEHVKRELEILGEKCKLFESDREEFERTVEKVREQYRLIVIERDELKDQVDTVSRRADDYQRRNVTLTESLRKTETSLSDVRSEVTTLEDRIKVLEQEGRGFREKSGHSHTKITELEAQISVLKAEIRTLTESRDQYFHDLEKAEMEYEELTETVETHEDSSKELEFEIESLRTMLREAREQKERAISARNAAEHEREDLTARYEEKCRELERFEESAAAHYHSHARSEGRTSSSTVRHFSRSSTAANGASSRFEQSGL